MTIGKKHETSFQLFRNTIIKMQDDTKGPKENIRLGWVLYKGYYQSFLFSAHNGCKILYRDIGNAPPGSAQYVTR